MLSILLRTVEEMASACFLSRKIYTRRSEFSMRKVTIAVLFACFLVLCGQAIPTVAANGPWWSTLADNSAGTASPVFSGLAGDWKITSGSYKIEHDTGLGTDVLTVTQGQLSVQGQTRY